jgi:uncharacterized protein
VRYVPILFFILACGKPLRVYTLETSYFLSQKLSLVKRSFKMSDKSKRGFASMDEDKQREIASKGGHAAHEKGTAHEFTSEEAREAGRKGGEAVSQDREHMAEIGSKGGKSSHRGSSKTDNDDEEKGTRGGTKEQHSQAGKQSHKNK